MKQQIIVFFLCFQTLFSFAQTENETVINLVIKNVSVLSMANDTILRDQDVVIKNGKISSISDAKIRDYKDNLVVDGKGKFIMPSLSDAHVHFPETEAEMERVMALYLINGVTKLRSMRGDWKHADWRAKYNSNTAMYPKLYLSPPPITKKAELTTSQIEKFVKTAKDNGFDFMKILSIKDQLTFNTLDSICKKYDMPIGGHFPSNLSDMSIFKSNYTSFEHLGGLTGNPEKVENRLQLIKEKNMFICPTLSWYSVGSGRYL